MAMVAAIGIASLNTDANLLLLVFGVGLGTIVAAALLTASGVRHLGVTRTLPPAATAGRPFTIRYHVSNRRLWRRAFSLNVTDRVDGPLLSGPPAAYLPVVQAGTPASAAFTTAASRRGRLTFTHVGLGTTFPLSLFARHLRRCATDEMLIYPAPGRLRRPLWNPRAPYDTTASGRHPTGIGAGEFYGLREYRYGDNPRWIHWRRSARTGQLLVREMSEHRPPRGVVVLDLHSPDASDETQQERAVRFAATLCCDGLDKGYQIGLITQTEPLAAIPPAAGGRHRAKLLGALALASDDGRGVAETLRHMRWRTGWRESSCVVVAAAEHARTREIAAWLTNRGAHVTLLIAGAPAFDDAFDDCRSDALPGGAA